MSPRILLLLPSTTYQAGAFLAAARSIGAELTVVSDRAIVFGHTMNFADPDQVTRRARELASGHPVDAVFGVDDLSAVAAAHAARALGLPHADPAAAEAARDKHRQRTLLMQAGVRVPRFILHPFDGGSSPALPGVSFPCVVKPTSLSMSRGVIRADDRAALAAALERVKTIARTADPGAAACLVEEFVPGPEVAVEGFLAGGRLKVLALFDKPDPLDGPFFAETIYATPSRLPGAVQRAVHELVERSARAIGLSLGPVHAEVRLGGGGPFLIELAARPIGGRCGAVLRFEPGLVSLEEVLLRAALGEWESGRVGEWEREDTPAAVYMIPVPKKGKLQSVSGLDEARAVPGVDDVVITAHLMQELLPLPEGNRYLGFIYARARTPEQAVDCVRAAHGKLVFALA